MIKHPRRYCFPADGNHEGRPGGYYDAVAGVMLPHVKRRLVTMERYPNGIDAKGFHQKDVSKGFPAWLKRASRRPRRAAWCTIPWPMDRRSLQCSPTRMRSPCTSGPRAPPHIGGPICAVSSSTHRATSPSGCAKRGGGARGGRGMGHPGWVQTSGSKWISRGGAARPAAPPTTTRGSGRQDGRPPGGAPRAISRRSSARPTATIIASSSTPGNRSGRRLPLSNGACENGPPLSAPCTWTDRHRRRAAANLHPATMRARSPRWANLWAGLCRAAPRGRSRVPAVGARHSAPGRCGLVEERFERLQRVGFACRLVGPQAQHAGKPTAIP